MRLIKKIVFLGAIALLTSLTISCEEDFTEVGSTIINNNKFNTKEIIFDVEMIQEDILSVNTGNTEIANLGEYLLGVYEKPNAKKIEAGMVSQLLLPSNLTVSSNDLKSGETLSSPHLDEVILKIPLKATLKGKINQTIINSQGTQETIKVPEFEIDSILGDVNQNFTIKVYRNGTYLSEIDLTDHTKKRVYLSNETYSTEGGILNTNTSINFNTIEKDTLFVFDRTYSDNSTYKDTLKVVNGNIKANPFIAIKLDKSSLKTALFDEYNSSKLSSQDALNEYFKGIIIKVESTSGGAIIPLDLSNTNLRPSIDFIHTTTILKSGNPSLDDNGKIKKIERVDSFYFGGIKASTYQMSSATALPNNVVIQGTAGSKASVKILNVDSDNNGKRDLEELREKEIIINNASLVFDINSSNTTDLPKRLFLFKNEENSQGDKIPTHFSDFLTDGPTVFSGVLQTTDNIPNNYTFQITRHLNEVIKGETPNSDLVLRVFNPIDIPTKTSIDIKNYNWNPKSVALLNNSTSGGTAKGVKLKIIYTEAKN